ncbi:MAG TPA: MarR family winged helix-turn-helix transcriptional regulator [Kofleriaceae bacterium]|jgi:DNA-binding MarR family transcriptional regulator
MSKIDVPKLWATKYRLLGQVFADVHPAIADLGLEMKELLLLSEVDEHPYPAELADVTFMPKPSVTLYLKNLEAAGHVKREIDKADLRRHRITLTPTGRKVMTKGLGLLADAFGKRLGRLTPAQQASLMHMLETMVAD